jgi:tocopherol O-methyltransferase
MIQVDGIKKSTIRSHYQLGTPFYRLLWGPHIHHGLWSGDESPSSAQLQLTDTLATMAAIGSGDQVLDVGCGMGGSSIRLALQRDGHVTGITLSPLQRHWAAMASRLQGARTRTRFLAADAETVHFDPESFDVVWSVECTEHLFDKPAFFQRAATWLRPGGRLVIAVWFEGTHSHRVEARRMVEEVCTRFVCPSLATPGDYTDWIESAGMRVTECVDWTDRVTKTWEICKDRVAKSGVRRLAKFMDQDQVAFLDGFDVLLEAYRSRAMQYGAIVATKPSGPNSNQFPTQVG